MVNNSEFRIEIDLRSKGKSEVFNSIEDIEKWLKKELEFWDWSEKVEKNDHQVRRRFRDYLNRLNDLQHHIENAKNNPNHQGFINQIQNHVKRYYDGGQLIHSSDPKAKFIKSIVEGDTIHAVCILNYMVNKKIDITPNEITRDFKAAMAAHLFEWNIKGKEDAETKSLKELHNNWSEILKKSTQELEVKINESAAIITKANENLAEQNATIDELIKNLESTSNEMIDSTKKKFKEIEDMYLKKLAMHSATSYWEEKSKQHNNHAIGWFIACGLAFVGVGYGLFLSISKVIGSHTMADVPLWKLSMLLLIAVVGVWALRILVRLLLSNVHLATDAHERKTMIITYLALLKDGSLNDDQSRHLILQALFRPSSTGIVKDDATPPFMAQWLKQATGND